MELLTTGQRVRGWWGVVIGSLSDREGEWFTSSISRKVGSGSSTSFWEDVWVGDSPLKSVFPRLYEVSLDKKCTVAEAGKWVENRWVWREGWRRELRVWESDSLSSLTNLLECRKQVPDDPDRWEWKPEANKSFAVRSAYELLRKRKMELNVGLKPHCKLIWENSAIPRAQAIAWRLLFRRLATRIELRRRGVLQVQSDVTCPLCSQSEEVAEHLFFNCNRTAMLWRSCLRWIGVHAPMHIDARVNLLHFCSLGSSKRHCSVLATLWVCTIWSIWKARNEVVFNRGDWKHDKIIGEIKAHLWAWAEGKGEQLKSNCSFHDWCVCPWQTLGLS